MRCVAAFSVVLVWLAVGVLLPSVAADESAPRNEISRAEHFLKKLEKQVQVYRGKPFPLSYESKEALRRVRTLKEKYPTDPTVEAMFQRARKAVVASKGEVFEITPKMLAYRENEKKLAKQLAALNVETWDEYVALLERKKALIEKPFPAPDPLRTSPTLMIGKYVLLAEFAYPQNEFRDTGGQYVFAGSARKGYYYVHLTNRAWLGAYEALKRYRREASQDLPEPWTLLGKITNVGLLVPQAGEEKTMDPHFGWVVEPVALYVPGILCATAEAGTERAGTYAGEDQLEQLKSSMYTYTEVPDDVEPKALLRIFATAIKEKNWKLYLDCIDPARRKTPKAISRMRYFYDNNQVRYHRFYVQVEPTEVASVEVIRGWRADKKSDEDFFLSKKDKEKIAEHADPLVEEARVRIKTYDERGKQVSLPNTIVLRRYEGKRWFVYSGFPL